MSVYRTESGENVVVQDDDPAYEEVDRSTSGTSMYWSPAQLIGVIAGLGFLVIGIAAVAKTGFDSAHIYTPQAQVWTFGHTPLLGLIEIGFGVLLLAGSCVPGAARGLMAFLGAASLALGLVIVLDAAPTRLHRWLGVTHRNGWLYIVTGAVVLLAAMLAPVFGGTARRRERHYVSSGV